MELKQEWSENKDRPAWVQMNRERIEEATGLTVPSRRSKIREWLESYKSQVTKELNEQQEDNE